MLFLGFHDDLVFTEEFTCDAGMHIVDDHGPLLGVGCVYRLIQLIRCCAGESAGFEREACDDEVCPRRRKPTEQAVA